MTLAGRQHEEVEKIETVHKMETAALSVEILHGHKEIARFLGLTPRQVSWHDEQGNLPTFKLGRTVCARKSKLLDWIGGLEQERHRERNTPQAQSGRALVPGTK